ncbi:carboxypeptidase-like regulatory domain-containing protein, partial [Singulisphaera rosea]
STTMATGPVPDAAHAAPIPNPVKPSTVHVKVVDPQGKGLPGAAITVFLSKDRVLKVKTDDGGLIVLDKLGVDDFFSLLVRGSDAVTGYTHYGRVPLPAGTADRPLVLTLAPSSHKVTGSVVDRKGQPIPGVRVIGSGLNYDESNLYVSRGQLEEEGFPLGSSLTDQQGRFTLAIPARAELPILFLHPRFVSRRFAISEDDLTIDPIALQPAGRITGRVVDAVTGAAVAGAKVGSQLLESPHESTGEIQNATSDLQGRFTIDGLESGVYDVIIAGVPGRPKATARAMVGVRIRSEKDTSVDLSVFDGIPLRGVVVDPTTGRPLHNVLVSCNGPANPARNNFGATRISDERGEFTFFVAPGENMIYVSFDYDSKKLSSRLGRASVSVPERGTLPPIRLLGPIPVHPPVALEAIHKERVSTVETSVSRKVGSYRIRGNFRGPKPAGGRTVVGRVLDTDGRPVVGVSVRSIVVKKTIGKNIWSLENRKVSTVVSDQQGVFVAKDLPREEVQMEAIRSEQWRETQKLTEIVPVGRTTVDFHFGPAPADPHPSQPAPAVDEPIPAALRDRLSFVDLGPRANEFLADGPGGRGDDLNRLLQGVHAHGNTYFRIGEKLIHLRSQAGQVLPETISSIAVGAQADRVRILHSARGIVPNGTEVAFYTVHYTDGTSERIPAVYGRNLGHWTSSKSQPLVAPTDASVAWTGSNDWGDRRTGHDMKIHLFELTWANPHPQRVIATIDATSTTATSELVLVGITLERTSAH